MTFSRNRVLAGTAVLGACAVLAACGSSSSSGTTGAGAASTPVASATTSSSSAPVSSAKIAIRNFMYSPMTVTVKAGAKVTFVNFDQTAHTATSIAHGFDTGTIQPGRSDTITLTKPGTFKYDCLFHPFMVATITVVK